jgi:purine-nucleoside phosphorylase
MEVAYTLPYNEIINFPVSTVQGHKGALVLGPLEIKNSSNARPFSFYEGYSMTEVTFPVRVMKF